MLHPHGHNDPWKFGSCFAQWLLRYSTAIGIMHLTVRETVFDILWHIAWLKGDVGLVKHVCAENSVGLGFYSPLTGRWAMPLEHFKHVKCKKNPNFKFLLEATFSWHSWSQCCGSEGNSNDVILEIVVSAQNCQQKLPCISHANNWTSSSQRKFVHLIAPEKMFLWCWGKQQSSSSCFPSACTS